MADKGGFLPVYTLTGAPPVMVSMNVKAGQTIRRGYPLTIYVDGTISSTAPAGCVMTALAASTGIIGVAAGPAAPTATQTGLRVDVWLAMPTTVFEGKATNTAAPEKYIGDLVDFEIVTTSNFRINTDAGTPKVIKIIGVHPDDRTGTATGKRFHFIWNPAKSICFSLERS